MKTKTTLLILVLLALSLRGFSQIGIGTTTPHASAAIDVTSTTSGLLPPRMTEAQRNVISTPAAGLIVYCTNCGANGELEIFNGSAWVNMAGGTAAAGPIVADAPAIGTVTSSSSGQAVVPFTAPASNGGSSITSYTATSSPGGVTGTLSQSGSGSITVTGLTNGTAYTFTVTATNGIGTSLTSTVSNSVTPLPPTVVVNTSASTTLTFMAHNLGADNSLDPHTPVQGIHGNYYQWGILAHVADASTPATAITPWNTTTAANGAWADGSKTANDPCPTGYRVPTNAQWLLVDSYNTQTTTGSFINNATNFGAARHFGAGANKLTLPAAGSRTASAGALSLRGNYGYYWSSSTENLSQASHLNVTTGNAFTSSNNRAFGLSVRCVSE
jgi:uncharacterized protein (TIGR02145 family)